MTDSQLYRRRIYKVKDPKTILFFICPFATKFWMVSGTIKKLKKNGYEIIAYDTTNDVFNAGDPNILVRIIDLVSGDIEKSIKHYKDMGYKDFCFFSSSLGAFIAYNCVSRIPELRWGVFNTGGNIAEALWRIRKPRLRHIKNGITQKQLAGAWRHLQYPKFSGLNGNSYIFLSGPSDRIAPIEDIDEYLIPVRQAGATVKVLSIKAVGHISIAIIGFRRAVQLLNQAKHNLNK